MKQAGRVACPWCTWASAGLAFCRSPEWKADCTRSHQCQSGIVWGCSALSGLHAAVASSNLHPELTSCESAAFCETVSMSLTDSLYPQIKC